MSDEVSETFKTFLKCKEDELAEQVGRFQAQRMMGIFNGEIGAESFFKRLYLLGKAEGKEAQKEVEIKK